MNTLRLNLWVKFPPFATLHPGKQILKMSLLSGVFFARQGHSFTGENKQRYLGAWMMTGAILGWSFYCFSNGFIYFLGSRIGLWIVCVYIYIYMYLQRSASYHVWHRQLTPISVEIGVASPTKVRGNERGVFCFRDKSQTQQQLLFFFFFFLKIVCSLRQSCESRLTSDSGPRCAWEYLKNEKWKKNKTKKKTRWTLMILHGELWRTGR